MRERDFELDMLKREVEEANRKKQKRKRVKPAEKPDPYASGALEKAIDELG
jgi:hypothetical protein